jgi:uncharacterized membrane protein (GlpM family)
MEYNKKKKILLFLLLRLLDKKKNMKKEGIFPSCMALAMIISYLLSSHEALRIWKHSSKLTMRISD